MSLLSRLFGGAAAAESKAEPEIYRDFRIFAEPQKEGGGFRLAARIEKEIGGEVKTHRLIRADTFGSADEAETMSKLKARAVIDQQGDAIFD
jgi:hypothetical protein